MTPAEKLLWRHLRDHRTAFHFRRQHPLHGYVLDFYCDEVRLCIEVDGEGHREFKQHSDEQRDQNLAEDNILTLRFTNTEVALETAAVMEKIINQIHQRAGLFPHIKNQGMVREKP